MIQASTNFSHLIAHHKVAGHRLVKEGVYAYVMFWSPSISSDIPLQVVKTPVVYWVLLLGRRDTDGPPELYMFHYIHFCPLEVLLPTHTL